MIDKNTHLNHLYVFPRLAVLSGHTHKGFIPYSHIFGKEQHTGRHLVLNAHITKLTPNSAVLSRAFPECSLPSSSVQPLTLLLLSASPSTTTQSLSKTSTTTITFTRLPALVRL